MIGILMAAFLGVLILNTVIQDYRERRCWIETEKYHNCVSRGLDREECTKAVPERCWKK